MKKVSKRDLAVVRECLASGIPLIAGERKFTAGQITDQISPDGRMVRTSHARGDGCSYIWASGNDIYFLALQAHEKMAHKDEILAEKAALRTAFENR